MSTASTEEFINACATVGRLLGSILVLHLLAREVVPVLQQQDQLLTRKQAALRMSVSVSTFDGWRREGVIKPVPSLGQRTIRYRANDLDKLTASKRK